MFSVQRSTQHVALQYEVLPDRAEARQESLCAFGTSELGRSHLAIENVFAVLHREVNGIALSSGACHTEQR